MEEVILLFERSKFSDAKESYFSEMFPGGGLGSTNVF